MTRSTALPRLTFGHAVDPLTDVAGGLDLLERSPPLWPVDSETWAAVVVSVAGFADRWDSQARAAGWSELELYGLHCGAPYANLAAMGAAFVLARSDSSAIDVSAHAIVTLSRFRAPCSGFTGFRRRNLARCWLGRSALVCASNALKDAELSRRL